MIFQFNQLQRKATCSVVVFLLFGADQAVRLPEVYPLATMSCCVLKGRW